MSISRKSFLKSTSLLLGGAVLGFHELVPKIFAGKLTGFRELRNNIGIYTEKGGTIGWYVNKEISAVIDSQFPETAENFIKGFQDRSSGKIDFLFNTHHHADHTSGNYFLKKHADHIVAHENCVKFQREQHKGEKTEDLQVYADMTFKNHWQRDLLKETVNAQYLGAAHTGGDSIIYFEKANIAHLGDLVFNGVYPFIDLPGGGIISNWIVVLEKAADTYPEDTLYIFGHAADEELVTGKKADLLVMRDYLTALLDYVTKESADGKQIEEIKKAEYIPGFETRKGMWEGALAMNIQAAYDELNKPGESNKIKE
jgi:cyclase